MKGLITVAIYIIISSFVDTSYLHSRTAKAILTFTQKKKKIPIWIRSEGFYLEIIFPK